MGDKELAVAIGTERHQELARPPVQRPGQVVFLVVARGGDFGLLSPEHPHRPDLGIGLEVDLILKQDDLVGRQVGQGWSDSSPL